MMIFNRLNIVLFYTTFNTEILHTVTYYCHSTTSKKDEGKWFENSEVYNRVLNFASTIGGGFKRLNYKQDYEYLRQPSNYVVYQGEKG